MKAMKLLIIYLLCVFPVFSVCFFMVMFGDVSIFYSGFALDSSGVLYVGTSNGIEKYQNEEKINVICRQMARSYAFTIQNDDTILFSTASTVYILDLNGNVIDEYDDTGTKVYNYLQSTKRVFATQDGKKYVMKSEFGRICICTDEEIIYQMPVTDYIVKVIWFFSDLSIFIFAPIIIIKWRKEEKQSMGESIRRRFAVNHRTVSCPDESAKCNINDLIRLLTNRKWLKNNNPKLLFDNYTKEIVDERLLLRLLKKSVFSSKLKECLIEIIFAIDEKSFTEKVFSFCLRYPGKFNLTLLTQLAHMWLSVEQLEKLNKRIKTPEAFCKLLCIYADDNYTDDEFADFLNRNKQHFLAINCLEVINKKSIKLTDSKLIILESILERLEN